MGRQILNITNVLAATAAYLSGRIQNATGPAENDGTPVIEELYGDIIQAWLKLQRDAGIVSNDLPDSETNDYQVYDGLVSYNRTYNGYIFGTATDFGAPSIYSGPRKAFGYKGKLYVLDLTDQEVKVIDINNETEIGAEAFGSGNLTSPNDLFIINDKAYITDGGLVKVFDITDGTYLSGQNMGSGTLTAGNGVFIQGNKAYVVDATALVIRVYNVASQAAIPGEDFGSGFSQAKKIEMGYGRAWIIDGTTTRVFEVDGGAVLSGENITTGASALDIRLVGNKIYAVLVSTGGIEVFDINTQNELVTEAFDDGDSFSSLEIYAGRSFLVTTSEVRTTGRMQLDINHRTIE